MPRAPAGPIMNIFYIKGYKIGKLDPNALVFKTIRASLRSALTFTIYQKKVVLKKSGYIIYPEKISIKHINIYIETLKLTFNQNSTGQNCVLFHPKDGANSVRCMIIQLWRRYL